MTTTRKYYVLIPAALSHNGEPYWQELRNVKSLTSAQSHVDRILGGIKEPEIWMSRNGGNKRLISRKSKGKWDVICDRQSADSSSYVNDRVQYYRHGRVSKEEFFAGFLQREKEITEERNRNDKS